MLESNSVTVTGMLHTSCFLTHKHSAADNIFPHYVFVSAILLIDLLIFIDLCDFNIGIDTIPTVI